MGAERIVVVEVSLDAVRREVVVIAADRIVDVREQAHAVGELPERRVLAMVAAEAELGRDVVRIHGRLEGRARALLPQRRRLLEDSLR